MDRDRLSLTTPEGITLELTLAGVGSRGAAVIIDGIIQVTALVALIFLFGLAGSSSGAVAVILTLVLDALFLLGYPILFEVFNAGQTPGKRAMNIRVMRADGGPITAGASIIRNVLRIVDWLPGVYIVGIISILSSTRNQRVGDMAGGAIVVQERSSQQPLRLQPQRLQAQPPRTIGSTTTVFDEPPPRIPGADPPPRSLADYPPPVVAPGEDVSLWETSQVTADEIAVVRRFLARRADMRMEDRQRMGHKLAVRLNAKVTRPPTEMQAEDFLSALIRARDSAH